MQWISDYKQSREEGRAALVKRWNPDKRMRCGSKTQVAGFKTDTKVEKSKKINAHKDYKLKKSMRKSMRKSISKAFS